MSYLNRETGNDLVDMTLHFPDIELPRKLVDTILTSHGCDYNFPERSWRRVSGKFQWVYPRPTCVAIDKSVYGYQVMNHLEGCHITQFFNDYGDHETYMSGQIANFFGY